MERPRNLIQAIDSIVVLHEVVEKQQETIETLTEGLEKLEHAQNRGLHAARKPPAIPPFPKALLDIGLRPPKKRKPSWHLRQAVP